MADYPPPDYPPPQYPPPPPEAVARGRNVLGAPADWWRRLVAILLDGLILSIPNAILNAILSVQAMTVDEATDEITIHPGDLLALTLVSLLVSVVYSGLMEGSAHGQSVGKMAMRIQVRDAETLEPIGFARAAGRRFFYQILFLPLFIPGFINGLSPLWDARRQAWHDKRFKTLVVNTS